MITKHSMRPFARRLAPLALALLLSAPVVHAQSDTVPPLRAPGRLIDLGGWRVHLNCTGEPRPAQPTVVLEAGAGGFSVDWSLVQPAVARIARVCSYDRAGAGWSDLGPRPRTLRQIVWELHELLRRGGERPPYVLVGHSYGGMLARQFAFTYRDEVAGIVLDESGHERGTVVFRDGRMIRLVDSATGRPVPEPKTSEPLRVADIPPAIRSQIEQSAQQMVTQAGRAGLPADAQRMRTWSYGQIRHWAANDNPFEGEELAALLARWTTTPYAFGDMPIVVLSRGRPESADTLREREHARDQAELLTLSRRARQVIARRAGHGILIDEPEVTIAAIRDVLAATRR
jgi:pimeloyl-ACP methyl ester carboxylesterase